MTREETIQLGIEFERRLIEIDPTFETINKVDTETIYSFLSLYLDLYLKDLFLLPDRVLSGTAASVKISDIIRTITKHKKCDIYNNASIYSGDNNVYRFKIPSDYFMYVRSNSIVSKYYKTDDRDRVAANQILVNKVIKESDALYILENAFNHGNIMRNPAVVIEDEKDSFKLITDRYTNVLGVDLTYYGFLPHFSILNKDSVCLLPSTCFYDLIQGAVDMYMYQYKYGVTMNNLKLRANKEKQQSDKNDLEDEE